MVVASSTRFLFRPSGVPRSFALPSVHKRARFTFHAVPNSCRLILEWALLRVFETHRQLRSVLTGRKVIYTFSLPRVPLIRSEAPVTYGMDAKAVVLPEGSDCVSGFLLACPFNEFYREPIGFQVTDYALLFNKFFF